MRYGELVADPLGTKDYVRTFCELPPTRRFERRLRRIPIEPADHKWRSQFGAEEVARLNSLLGDDLARYGYSA